MNDSFAHDGPPPPLHAFELEILLLLFLMCESDYNKFIP